MERAAVLAPMEASWEEGRRASEGWLRCGMLRVEVPFYRGWERGSGGGEGRLNGRSNGGDSEWRLRPLKLVKAWVEGG
jgi:hypothetical protein